jgi:hypothetical protein
MEVRAVFENAPSGRGMYESFYLRAVAPDEPVGVWIRHTVHKAPGQPPRASVWCTVFDARLGAPFTHKVTRDELSVPAGEWIAVGSDAVMGPSSANGACGPASWELTYDALDAELRHLRPDWLYRTPVPRTKLTSPAPAASFSGSVLIPGRDPIELIDWPGMIGHNWGSEHAARWIWLHGIGFQEQPGAWVDLAIGRVEIAGRLSPWIASGAVSVDGRRSHLGGLAAHGARVEDGPDGCAVELLGRKGTAVAVRARVPAGAAAGWRYSDPDGGEHDVVNCSVAELRLELRGAGPTRVLLTGHGGAFELGMRERDHGVPIAPFTDG